ncbi:MAG: hypothetical protein ACLRSE_13430, partial [Alistipes finegoldii]
RPNCCWATNCWSFRTAARSLATTYKDMGIDDVMKLWDRLRRRPALRIPESSRACGARAMSGIQ